MLNTILLIVIAAVLIFVGWKFMVANKKENIAALIQTGASAGIEPLLSFLKRDTVQPAIAEGAEFTARFFFQALGRSQYEAFTKQLNLPALNSQALDEVDQKASLLISRLVQPRAGADLNELQTTLHQVAKNFTQNVATAQKEHQGEADIHACTIPLVKKTSDELSKLIFKPETDEELRSEFNAVLTTALQATAEQVFKSVSGKDDAGRYLGGGCC